MKETISSSSKVTSNVTFRNLIPPECQEQTLCHCQPQTVEQNEQQSGRKILNSIFKGLVQVKVLEGLRNKVGRLEAKSLHLTKVCLYTHLLMVAIKMEENER